MDSLKGLREIAKSMRLKGYSKMNKTELYDAIVEAKLQLESDDLTPLEKVVIAENIQIKK
tara:strand:+ start:815 stop:994 length:180 start_codon:yes stop_codon:yes gene_type:complete